MPKAEKVVLIEVIKLLPECQAAALKNVLRISKLRQQTSDVSKNMRLIPQRIVQEQIVTLVEFRYWEHAD
jgi:hypothetical protein